MSYSRPYKLYVTVLLLVIYIFNQVDRSVFGILMEPIKRELGLTDTQLGFLAGPALVVFYALLGVPIARLADRSHRVNIMSIAIVVWSSVVTLTASVGTFWQFALARVGVGIGEAGFSAVAQSLIGDYHNAKERTRALSIFLLGMPLGAVVSSLLGGWVNQAYGWRAVFIVAGVPGLVLAVLMKCTVKEVRHANPATTMASRDVARPPMRAVLTKLWQVRTLRHLIIAQGLRNMCANFLGWLAVFFMRGHNMSSGELGTWLAVAAGVGGTTGIWLGGYLTSRFGAQDARIKARLMSVATALIAPTALMVLWSPSTLPALLLLLPLTVLESFCYAPTFSLVQTLSHANMRATMVSIFILCQILCGGVIGIQLLGIVSDVLTPVVGSSAEALRWGMTFACPLALWSAAHFWLAGRTLRKDLREAEGDQINSTG